MPPGAFTVTFSGSVPLLATLKCLVWENTPLSISMLKLSDVGETEKFTFTGCYCCPATYHSVAPAQAARTRQSETRRETQTRDGSRKRLARYASTISSPISPNGGDKAAREPRLHSLNLSSGTLSAGSFACSEENQLREPRAPNRTIDGQDFPKYVSITCCFTKFKGFWSNDGPLRALTP